MKQINKLRLLAGIPIDGSIEVTPVAESSTNVDIISEADSNNNWKYQEYKTPDIDDITDESPSQLRTPNKDSEQDQSTQDLEKDIIVPASIKSSLQSAITKATKESKKLKSDDTESYNFYRSLAQAFTDILNYLNAGTNYDLKNAQVYAQSLMGPMLHKIPTDVWKYLANGGEQRSLKGIMVDISNEYPKLGPQNKLKS